MRINSSFQLNPFSCYYPNSAIFKLSLNNIYFYDI